MNAQAAAAVAAAAAATAAAELCRDADGIQRTSIIVIASFADYCIHRCLRSKTPELAVKQSNFR